MADELEVEIPEVETGKSDEDILSTGEEKPKEEETKSEEETSEEEEERLAKEEALKGEKKEEEKKEEKEEEEEELVRLSYKDLKEALKDKPEIFKAAKAAFFREQEFSKRFSNLEDADRALEVQAAYETVRSTVLDGDAKTFLSEIAEVSPKSLKTFAENFLPALREADEQAFLDATKPVMKTILKNLYARGKSKNDKNIFNAALVAHDEIFGGYDFDKESEPKKPVEKDEKFEEEKEQFYSRKQGELVSGITKETGDALTAMIEKNLDPTNSIKPGLKKLLIEKIRQEVDDSVAKDENHMKRMTALWEREARNGFTGGLKDSIKTAYLSRAGSLIPAIRKRIREEVFETQVSQDKSAADKAKQQQRAEPGKRVAQASSKVTVKEARDKKLSDLDILSS